MELALSPMSDEVVASEAPLDLRKQSAKDEAPSEAVDLIVHQAKSSALDGFTSKLVRRETVGAYDLLDRRLLLFGDSLEIDPRLVVVLLRHAQRPDLGPIGAAVMADVIRVAEQ